MRINKSFKHRSSGILLQVILFFALQGVLNLNGLYSNDGKSMDRLPDVSIHFEFDPRMKARPARVFLLRDKELHNIIWEWKEPILFQCYQSGKIAYDFYNIKPGIYWVGITLNFLHRDGRVIECEYVRPAIFTGGSKDTRNQIEVKKNKRVTVDLIIQLHLDERPKGDADSSGYLRYVERSRPKTPEEKMMLDENYFPLGIGAFLSVKRSCSKNIAHSEIEFLIHGFDDHPFEDSQPEEIR